MKGGKHMENNQSISWTSHIGPIGARTKATEFPGLSGIFISISRFPHARKLLKGYHSHNGEFDKHLICNTLSGRVGESGRYAFNPFSLYDAKLWLNSVDDASCIDCPVNEAFFYKGDLVGIYSIRAKDRRESSFVGKQYDNFKEMYHFELENCCAFEDVPFRLARASNIMELILKAESPKGNELPQIYRDSIRGILE